MSVQGVLGLLLWSEPMDYRSVEANAASNANNRVARLQARLYAIQAA